MADFSGFELGLGNIFKLSNTRTRSISPENFTGEKGRGAMATEGTGKIHARDLGAGWKISPSIVIDPHQTFVLGDIKGSGLIQHIWFATIKGRLRNLVLRIFWDDHAHPSVECPLGDFFANGLEHYMPVQSLPICVNSTRALNCYRIFVQITAPMSVNTVITVMFVNTIFIWNDFIFANTFVLDERMKTVPLGLQSYMGAMGSTDWTATFSAVGVTVTPLLLVLLALNRAIIYGIQGGAAKG